MSTELATIRNRIKSAFTDDISEGEAFDLLSATATLELTADTLKSTKIGISLNKLFKKLPTGPARTLAQDILKKWMKIAEPDNNSNSNSNKSDKNKSNSGDNANDNASIGSNSIKKENSFGTVDNNNNNSSTMSSSSSIQTGTTTIETPLTLQLPREGSLDSATSDVTYSVISSPHTAVDETNASFINSTANTPLGHRPFNNEAVMAKLPSNRKNTVDLLRNKVFVDEQVPRDILDRVSLLLESEVNQLFPIDSQRTNYDRKVITLLQNLKKNKELRDDLYSGLMCFSDLVRLSTRDLAPDKLKQMRESQAQADQIASRSDLNDIVREAVRKQNNINGNAEGDVRCRRCKSYNVTVNPVQTRSSDEPMTLICKCLACGQNWRQY